MRYILSILILLCSVTAFGQVPEQFLGSPGNRIVVRGQLKIDSLLIVPSRLDTLFIPGTANALVYNSSDKRIYYYDGLRWHGVMYGDSLVYATAFGVDTAKSNIRSEIALSLDSIVIYTASGTNPDTLYSYKDGDSVLVGYIPKFTGITTDATLTGNGLASNPLKVDTSLMSTRAWRQKGDDSLGAIIATKLSAVNLDTTRDATSVTILNDAGDDAVIPLVSIPANKAGLISPAMAAHIDSSMNGSLSWSLVGNAGIVDGTHFIGTKNNVALNFRVANVPSGRIDSFRHFTSFGFGAAPTTNRANITAFGYHALASNTLGNNLTAIGAETLESNTTGGNNVAVGYQALKSSDTGSYNTAVGFQTMRYNFNGTNNTALGAYALRNNDSASRTVAVGVSAFESLRRGHYNTAIGYGAGASTSSTDSTTFIGMFAGFNNTTGRANTFVGAGAGRGITTGSYNTIIGAQVTGLPSSLSNNIILADGQGNIRLRFDNTGALNVSLLPTVTDTTAFKPLVQDGSGNVRRFGYWSATGADVNLDTTRTDSTVIVVNSTGGSDALIFPADTVRAGVMRASDKKKLDRIEILKNMTELRSVTVFDTTIIYRLIQNKVIGDYYYDPTDNSSADDSATVIVINGKRLKKYFGGIYRPEDFGARGDGITNDWWAWQKMINYLATSTGGGAIWCDPRANYKIDTNHVINIPGFADRKILVVYGNGCKITGKRIFQRRPANQSQANTWQGFAPVFREIQFVGSGGIADSNAVALDIGATYGAMVEKCTFTSFDTAIIFRFGLNSTTRQNIIAPRKVGIAFTHGGVWGGGLSNSQSNGSVSDQDRIFGTGSRGEKGIYFEAASDCEVRRAIVEGTAMDYAIYFDSRSQPVVTNFRILGAHIEFPTGPKRAAIFLRSTGQIDVEDIYIQVVDTFMVVDGTPAVEVHIRNIPFLPTGAKFASYEQNNGFTFSGMPSTFFPNSTFFVVGGGFNYPAVRYNSTLSVRVGNLDGGEYIIRDSSATNVRGFGLSKASNGSLRIYGGHLLFNEHNTYDIGLSTNLSPRSIFAGTGMVVAQGASGFRFGSLAGVGITDISGESSSLRCAIGAGNSTSATGGLAIPYGTTAQRPSANINGFIRGNSDTAALEWKISNAWHTIASRNWVRTTLNDSTSALRTLINSKATQAALVDTASDIREALADSAAALRSELSAGLTGLTAGRITFANSSTSISDDANLLYSPERGGTFSLGTTSAVGRFNIGGNRNFDGTNSTTGWGAGFLSESATYTDTVVEASGATNFAQYYLAPPILSASNSSVTTSFPTTLRVSAPIMGTNVSASTYPLALYAGGAVRIEGAIRTAISAASSGSTASYAYSTYTCDASGGNYTINLPLASVYTGVTFTFKRVDNSGNTCTVVATGGDTIDGASDYALSAQYKYVKLTSDGTQWLVVGSN